MAVSERTFGVEIECTFGTKPTKSDLLWGDPDRNIQLRSARKAFAAHPDLSEWSKNIGMDGSGIEIRSPVLKGEAGIEELTAAFNFLIERGSSVTNQDGMHVHHGAKDVAKDYKALFRLVKSWADYTPVINQMVAPRRRTSNMCSHTWNKTNLATLEKICTSEKTVAELEKEYRVLYDRWVRGGYVGNRPNHVRRPDGIAGRGALNISNIHRTNRQTIEIRLAEGMMDVEAAVAWVKFGQSFIDAHMKRVYPLACAQTLDAVFKAIDLDPFARKVLREKAANKGNALKNAAPGRIADGIVFDEREV